jgi:hypothetical protein
MKALGFADLLIANKYKPAISTVATAYGETEEAYHSWKMGKRLGKTTDARIRSFKTNVVKLSWNEPHILAELKRVGQKYQAEKKIKFKNKKIKI